jgi:hypothetical protein
MDLRFALCAQKKLPELVGSQGGKGLRYFPGAIGRLVTKASCFSRRSGCSSSQWFTKCLIGFHAGQGNFAVRRDMQPHAPDAGSPRQTLDGDNDLPRGVAERLPKKNFHVSQLITTRPCRVGGRIQTSTSSGQETFLENGLFAESGLC